MSTQTNIEGIKANVERNLSEDLSILWKDDPNVQKWNNLDSEEIKQLVNETFELLNISIEKNLLVDLPFNYLNAITNGLNNFNTQFQTVKSLQPNQLRNQHHNPLNQVNSINTQIRNSGLFSLIKLSPNIPETDKLIQAQLTNINAKKEELDKLTTQVRTLLSPAVADRLSTAFSKRKQQIFWQKIGWLTLVIISISTAIYYTSDVTQTISELIKPNQDGGSIDEPTTIGIIWILRLLILFPIYYVVFFSIKQYSKERKLEEVYAHKSAITETLPSYPELLTDKSVGDGITSEATSVIFSPAEKETEKNSNSKNYKMADLKELMEIAAKIPKGTE